MGGHLTLKGIVKAMLNSCWEFNQKSIDDRICCLTIQVNWSILTFTQLKFEEDERMKFFSGLLKAKQYIWNIEHTGNVPLKFGIITYPFSYVAYYRNAMSKSDSNFRDITGKGQSVESNFPRYYRKVKACFWSEGMSGGRPAARPAQCRQRL